MKVLKRSISLILTIGLILSNCIYNSAVYAEDTTIEASNTVLVDLINRKYAHHPNYPNSTTMSNLFTQSYSANGTDYNYDKVAAIEFEEVDLSEAFSIKLSFQSWWEKPTTNYVEVYMVQDCVLDKTDYETTADSVNSAQQTLVGTLPVNASENNNDWIRIVSLDTSLLKQGVDENGKLQLIVRIKNKTNRTYNLDNGDFGLAKLVITNDIAPTISEETISGVPVEGFDLNVDYVFSSDLHEEKDSEIDWLCADSADGDNETEVLTDGGKKFHIESECVGKYIRARLTPHSNAGLYIKGGKEHPNIYYTDYIGPIKNVAYLDELAIAIRSECSNTTELYDYMYSYKDTFGIDVTGLDSYSKKEQVLENIMENPPKNFADLTSKYSNEFATIKIEEASADDIEGLLAETEIDLGQYEELDDTDFVLVSLESETFLKYQDLDTAFSCFVTGSLIKNETSSEMLAVMLENNSQIFTADIENCSYGEILYAGRYIVDADKTAVTDFNKLDTLISEAIEYGKENYAGGFITSKKSFVDELCIKTDYSSDSKGINSTLPIAASYSLFGNTNVEEYTQQLLFKLDISDLMDYNIYSASINLYGTVGGGADKIIEIVSAGDFDSPEDFLNKYPTGADVIRGEVLGQVKYSFGTSKWNKADITDIITEKAKAGESYVYLMIDYTENAVGCDLSKAAQIHSITADETKAPYVEIIYETPPVVKNINISGVKAVGSKLTAEYDYFGCYEEGDSVYQWYYADKNGDNYENKTPISQENSSSLDIKAEYAGKCIMLEIKPCCDEGTYKEGEFTPSGFTLPMLNSSEADELTNDLNSAADIISVLSDGVKAQYLDVDTAADMEILEDEGKTKVLSILTNTAFTDLNNFKAYYTRMINVQAINEATYEELDELIQNSETGTATERYSAFEDNTSILNAVYNKGFESVEAYQTAYNEACAVYEFNTVDHSNVEDLLVAYDFMFSQNVSSYDDDKLELVGNFFMTEIQNKKGSFAGIQSALTSAVSSAENYTPSIDVPSGGNSGSSGGGRDKEIQVPPSSETAAQVAPVVPAKVFKDQDEIAEWAKDSVLKLNASGVISGDGNGNFRPDDSITREEFLKIVVTVFDINSEGEAEFEDVDKDTWYSEYINKAISAGIINGIGENKFGTGMYISREDMSVILHRALRLKGQIKDSASSSIFEDRDEIADYAERAVSVLVKYGVINGVGGNRFAPKSNSTRAMAAVMVCRALEIQK